MAYAGQKNLAGARGDGGVASHATASSTERTSRSMSVLRNPIMKSVFFGLLLLAGAMLDWCNSAHAAATNSGTLWIDTTPNGADLPAAAVLEGFPLLVRLHADWFDFTLARPRGADLRFFGSDGKPLAFQIEQWNPEQGTASVWVRVPLIKGQDRQPITMQWRGDSAQPLSDQKVFDATNGFVTVIHMAGEARDETGLLLLKDTGTADVDGVIGQGRRFDGKGGITGGDAIVALPQGSSPSSSQAWIRVRKPNSRILAWGREEPQGKVVMQFRSPPHIGTDCWFSDGNAESQSRLPMDEWIHVVHTYGPDGGRIYVNGKLDSVPPRKGTPLALKTPAHFRVGGFRDAFDFVGEIDEVRISNVARSGDWIRMEYENQKPRQTAVGHLVQPGRSFSVKPERLTVDEAKIAKVSVNAGGAEKIFWSLKRSGQETTLATDRLSLAFDAGRVKGDERCSLVVKAIFPDGTKSVSKTLEIPVTIREVMPDPVFTVKVPSTWDGRSPLDIAPVVSNQARLDAAGAGPWRATFHVDGVGVTKRADARALHLKRALASGNLQVTVSVDNGGTPSMQSADIAVKLPAKDPWVTREPAADEKPSDHQFYARGPNGEGMLHHNGTLEAAADSVFLTVAADGKKPVRKEQPLGADRSYRFAVPLEAGLFTYAVTFGSITGGKETVLHTATDIVCGDA